MFIMKKISLPYWKLDDVEMASLDSVLLEISEVDVIKKAIVNEPKLKASAMQYRMKDTLDNEFIEQIANHLEEYFNVFNHLGNHFLAKQSKKYEPIAKQFVQLQPAQYELFLTEHLKNNRDIYYLLTMVRFLKKNSTYSEQIKYLLQSDMFKREKQTKTLGLQNEVKTVDPQNIQKQMHEMLDDIFKLFGDPEQIAVLKEEHAANIKKIKSLEKKISGITKELDSTKEDLTQERNSHKEAKVFIIEQKQSFEKQQEEITQLNDVNSGLQKELKVLRNTLDHQEAKHKKTLEAFEESLRKKYQSEIIKIEEEKKALEESVQTLAVTSSDLKNTNTKLKEEVMQANEIMKSLQEKLTETQIELSTAKEIAYSKLKANVMPESSVNTTTKNTIQKADSHLLKTVGFNPDEINTDLEEDDSDLFDIDENVPSFD